MKWKNLDIVNYKNYKYIIQGFYCDDIMELHPYLTDYSSGIFTNLIIYNEKNEIIFDKKYNDDFILNNEDFQYQYLIHFRNIYKKSYLNMKGKIKINTINIKDDYYRVMKDWKDYARNHIDNEISKKTKKIIKSRNYR